MTNAELIAKIKAEIERLKEINKRTLDGQLKAGCLYALNQVLPFLDTLEESEKPMNLEDAMKELDEKIALVKQRGTWDGVDVDKYMDEVRGREPEKPMTQDELEKEINRYLEPIHTVDIQFEPFSQMTKCASHFAEWGYLRAAEKYNEIEYNRQRAEEEIPKDLEEAAKKEYPCDKSCMTPDMLDLNAHKQVAFRKGAKWQEEHTPLSEDTVLFNKGVEEGRRLAEEELSDFLTIAHLQGADQMKEQMMEEAVEGLFQNTPFPTICLDDCKNYDLKEGDKVRIIIVKKDKK